MLLYTLIQRMTFIFEIFQILPPLRGSEDIKFFLKYENFKMMIESLYIA